MWKKGKLNVNECFIRVINRTLIWSLNDRSYSDLGEQSNRISPKCQESCCYVTEGISFPHIQQFLNINT